MRVPPVQIQPHYFIESVDNALRALQLVRDGGAVRIKDISDELGVAPSTAHRLLSMLVYRGFAIQEDDRRYTAGPSLGAAAIGSSWTRDVRRLTRGPLIELCEELGESVNIMVRIGTSVRILSSVEASSAHSVTSREGAVMPARRTSGGKALLASLTPSFVTALYSNNNDDLSNESLTPPLLHELAQDLDGCRRRRYAINRAEYEPGIGTVGVAVPMTSRPPLVAFCAAAPLTRFGELNTPGSIELLFSARDQMAAILSAEESLNSLQT